MTQHRNRQTSNTKRAARQLCVMLAIAIAFGGLGIGCSTEARYRIKSVIFTGVPAPHEEQTPGEVGQADAPRTPADEQSAKQQQYREALISHYWQHGPFAAGECGRCHSLSQSKSFLGSRDVPDQAPTSTSRVSASSRLVMPKQRLCVTCHSQHGPAFARERNLQQHPPAALGACTTCHNPHQSLRQYMLLEADNRELCGGCHDRTGLSPVHAEDPQRDCIGCHNAHVGVTSKMLRSDAREMALLYDGDIDD